MMTTLRKWATPMTIGSFLIMSVTGILMFYHLDSGLNKTVHEWASWAMIAGVSAHLLMNWRAFTTYFKRPLARGIIGVGALVLALSFLPVTGGERGKPVDALLTAMDRADVETVIALSGQELDQGLAMLARAGMRAQPDSRVQSLTAGDRHSQMELIKVLFVQ